MEALLPLLVLSKGLFVELSKIIEFSTDSLGYNPFLSLIIILLVGAIGKASIYKSRFLERNKGNYLLILCVLVSFLFVWLNSAEPIILKTYLYQALSLSAISTFNYRIVKSIVTSLVNHLFQKLGKKIDREMKVLGEDDLLA